MSCVTLEAKSKHANLSESSSWEAEKAIIFAEGKGFGRSQYDLKEKSVGRWMATSTDSSNLKTFSKVLARALSKLTDFFI